MPQITCCSVYKMADLKALSVSVIPNSSLCWHILIVFSHWNWDFPDSWDEEWFYLNWNLLASGSGSCPKGPWRQPFPVDTHVWPRAVPNLYGAFGKPQATVTRVHIGQVMPIITMLQNKEHVNEAALHRAKVKSTSPSEALLNLLWIHLNTIRWGTCNFRCFLKTETFFFHIFTFSREH